MSKIIKIKIMIYNLIKNILVKIKVKGLIILKRILYGDKQNNH